MSHNGEFGREDGRATARVDPKDLKEFVSEKYVEVDTSADDYDAVGLTELELCEQYCRACTVSVQRLFHVKSLGMVCTRALSTGNEAFPLDLVETLAQDDDSEVRQIVAEQLGVFIEALKTARREQETDVATGLLYVAFLLVEDDADGVVEAAEVAVSTVATVLDREEDVELLLTLLANLAKGQEEEIRVSAAKICGGLARVVGGGVSEQTLAPILRTIASDEALQAREAAARAIVKVAEVMDDAIAEDALLPSFKKLAKDAIWSVRRACAENLVELSKCFSRETFVKVAHDLFEPLANDVSFQVRTAALEKLGPLVAELGGEHTSAALVDHFVSMSESTGGNNGLQLSCAFNIPGVAYTIGHARWHEIRPAYNVLAHSVQWRVRRSLACSLHEMAKILGKETTQRDLLPIFEAMLSDTDEVVVGVIDHLAEFMSQVAPHARTGPLYLLQDVGKAEGKNVIGNWRLRAALSEQLGALSKVLPEDANEDALLPLLLRLLKDPASAVRAKSIDAVGGVLHNTAKASSLRWRSGKVGDVVAEIKLMATNPRWLDRQAYVQMCGAFVGVVDANIIKEEFLPLMLMCVDDAVPNVKRELARSLARLDGDRSFAGIPDVLDTIRTLRNDPDVESVSIAKNYVAEERSNGEYTTGLGGEFHATGLR
jgi:serine/threonine-protein phosphatase 4 regulatory subunit 1